MNTKLFLTLTALLGAIGTGSALAQTSAGSGAAGSAAGGTTAAPGSGASTTTGPTGLGHAGSAGGSDVGALPAPGTPNMSPSMPNRSVLETSPKTREQSQADGATQPSSIEAAPPRPGVSPLSGLPTASLPSVSAGTAPIGPQPAGSARSSTAAESSSRPRTTDTQPVADAAHPQVNFQTGMGVTTVVPTPPPAAHVEVAPPATPADADRVWVPGHYTWLNGQWTWNEGNWQRPPSPGARWVPGSYDSQSHRWTDGHWETTPSAVNRERAGDRERRRADER